MTLVLVTGAGLATENSYFDPTTAEDYEALTGFDATTFKALDTAEKEQLAIKATLKFDNSYRFYGKPLTTTQLRSWPRTKNYDQLGREIPAGTIPEQLVKATFQLAAMMGADEGLRDVQSVEDGQTIKSLSIDSLSIDFEEKTSTKNRIQLLYSTRVADIESLLRSIGQPLTEDWMISNKLTETYRDG